MSHCAMGTADEWVVIRRRRKGWGGGGEGAEGVGGRGKGVSEFLVFDARSAGTFISRREGVGGEVEEGVTIKKKKRRKKKKKKKLPTI